MGMRLIVASLALIAGSAEARTMHCAPVNRAAIDQQFSRFNQALLSRDADKVTALFAPDAVLLPTLSDEMRTTRAGIRDYFVHFLEKSPDGRVDKSETKIGCNEASRMGNWSIEVTDPKTHEKSTVHARFTFIYRYSGGRWWIEHLHSSLMPGGH
jgi:uncharacterized protein (TIGR02246 family)